MPPFINRKVERCKKWRKRRRVEHIYTFPPVKEEADEAKAQE
jgi:hypothetical protein